MRLKYLLLHEWLLTRGGSERVVDELLNVFPIESVVTLFYRRDYELPRSVPVRSSFLNRLPRVGAYYRQLLPFYPIAVSALDVRGYDVIISSSHSLIKCVGKSPSQLHICYCHTPPRYLYDFRASYFPGIGGAVAGPALDLIARWDRERSRGVDHFIANSKYVADRIGRIYGKESEVIYPPCRTDFGPPAAKEDFFLTAGRFVPYKRMDLVVSAFNELGLPLVVAGGGPLFRSVSAIAGPNVRMLGWVKESELTGLMKKARAFVFAAEEDFGIVCVEAQACATPVICYRKGGQSETVVELSDGDGRPTGVFFGEQSAGSIVRAVREFASAEGAFAPDSLIANAKRFSADRFRREIKSFVDSRVAVLR